MYAMFGVVVFIAFIGFVVRSCVRNKSANVATGSMTGSRMSARNDASVTPTGAIFDTVSENSGSASYRHGIANPACDVITNIPGPAVVAGMGEGDAGVEVGRGSGAERGAGAEKGAEKRAEAERAETMSASGSIEEHPPPSYNDCLATSQHVAWMGTDQQQ